MSDDISYEGIAALILAAGGSTRMGSFKPLLRLGQETVIERVVGIAREAGVRDLLAVVGHEGERLFPLLTIRGVPWVINGDFQRGMFSSIQTGVQYLKSNCRAFFVMPADMPLINPETLKRLLVVFHKEECHSCRPCYGQRRGHPPLISTALVPSILAYDGKGGLRVFLANHVKKARNVEVDDPGILVDLDTPEDAHKHIRQRADNLTY